MRLFKASVPLLLLLAAGCSGGSGEKAGTDQPTTGAPAGTTPNKVSDFKVALLTPSEVSDAGWSALAYDGLQAIKADLNAETNNQVAAGTQIKDALRSYAQKNYNLVF